MGKALRAPVAMFAQPLDARIQRAMDLEGVSSFADFARSSLTHRCREIERDHGIQQTPAKSS